MPGISADGAAVAFRGALQRLIDSGRDSNPRPRHYECSAQAESRLISIAYSAQISPQGRFRPFKAIHIRIELSQKPSHSYLAAAFSARPSGEP